MKEIMRDSYGLFFEGDRRCAGCSPSLLGYFERWYEGGLNRSIGIRVDDGGLELPGLIIPGDWIPLGDVGFFGIGLQNKAYDQKSALVCGAIVTYAERSEYMDSKGGTSHCITSMVRVSEEMPKRIVSIFAETPDRIFDAAKILRLQAE